MLLLYADHSCRGHGREEGAGKTTDCVVQCHDPLLVFPPCVHVAIFSFSLSHSLSLFFCCFFFVSCFPPFRLQSAIMSTCVVGGAVNVEGVKKTYCS